MKVYLRSVESEVVAIRNDGDLNISFADVVAIEFLGSNLRCLLILKQDWAKTILSAISANAENGTLFNVPVVSEKVGDLLIPNLVRQASDFHSDFVFFLDYSYTY